jgi:hypothetical protein
MNPLHEKATRIQRMARAVRQRRRNTDRQYQEQISREFDENITRSRQEELQRNQDAINELDQILRQDALKQSSATRIQSAVRNHNALNESIKRAKQKMTTKENTASKISKQTLDDAMNEIVNEDAAATTISSILRGHKGRKQFKLKKEYPIIA